MADEVELIHDGQGLAVMGEQEAVKRFLDHTDLWSVSQDLRLDGFTRALDAASGIAEVASKATSTAGRYVKLTEESARDIRKFGLVPTATEGVSYAMVGRPGSITKWVQIETGVASWLTNPAILSGAAGIMAQLARQQEVKELKRLLESIDSKLNDVRRQQKNAVLSKLNSAGMAIADARRLCERGGDCETAWQKVANETRIVFEVEANAFRAIEALSDKVDRSDSVRRLRKTTEEVAPEVVMWLAVLAECFRLEDQHAILELEHVGATAPSSLDAHRLGLEDAQRDRREQIVDKTGRLLRRLTEAGEVASENVILHQWAAQAVVDSVNAVGMEIDKFHALLGIDPHHALLSVPGWREALRDRRQWSKARDEAKPLVTRVGRFLVVVGVAMVLGSSTDSEDGDSADEA